MIHTGRRSVASPRQVRRKRSFTGREDSTTPADAGGSAGCGVDWLSNAETRRLCARWCSALSHQSQRADRREPRRLRHRSVLHRRGAAARAAALRRQPVADRGSGQPPGPTGKRPQDEGSLARGAGRDPAGRCDPTGGGCGSRARQAAAAGSCGEGRSAQYHPETHDRAPEPDLRVGARRRRESHHLGSPDRGRTGRFRGWRSLSPAG